MKCALRATSQTAAEFFGGIYYKHAAPLELGVRAGSPRQTWQAPAALL
jgi:hypothetical protein